MEATRRKMDRLRLIGLIAVGLAALVATEPAARAQYRLEFNYCDRLQAQYRGALQQAGNAGVTGQQMVRIDQLSQQLAQAQLAARQYGCTGGFLFFGPTPSRQCPAIMGQVNRLSAQLRQLRGNDFYFFGTSPEAEVARLRDALTRNGCDVPVAGGTRTLCVRLCDGYYFPIEFDAASSRFSTDAAACQSMYAQDGQAELFVQANSDDVANATSLSGQRYGDQPYAFAYRQDYTPACVAQLHTGLSALAARYTALLPPPAKVASVVPRTPMPIPQPRRPFSQDPETLANAAGHFTVKPVRPGALALAAAPAKHVRMVGPAYYADMFDLSKVRKQQESLRPTFSMVTPAAAEEKPAAAQAVAQPAPPAIAEPAAPASYCELAFGFTSRMAPPLVERRASKSHLRHSLGQNMPAC